MTDNQKLTLAIKLLAEALNGVGSKSLVSKGMKLDGKTYDLKFEETGEAK